MDIADRLKRPNKKADTGCDGKPVETQKAAQRIRQIDHHEDANGDDVGLRRPRGCKGMKQEAADTNDGNEQNKPGFDDIPFLTRQAKVRDGGEECGK